MQRERALERSSEAGRGVQFPNFFAYQSKTLDFIDPYIFFWLFHVPIRSFFLVQTSSSPEFTSHHKSAHTSKHPKKKHKKPPFKSFNSLLPSFHISKKILCHIIHNHLFPSPYLPFLKIHPTQNLHSSHQVSSLPHIFSLPSLISHLSSPHISSPRFLIPSHNNTSLPTPLTTLTQSLTASPPYITVPLLLLLFILPTIIIMMVRSGGRIVRVCRRSIIWTWLCLLQILFVVLL